MRDDAVLGRALPLDRGLGPPNETPIHQRPLYQIHIIQCGTIIAYAL